MEEGSADEGGVDGDDMSAKRDWSGIEEEEEMGSPEPEIMEAPKVEEPKEEKEPKEKKEGSNSSLETLESEIEELGKKLSTQVKDEEKKYCIEGHIEDILAVIKEIKKDLK